MLCLDRVSKRFGARAVLQELSFRVAPGEVYGLLGPNGAGKSTTFNLICNLLVPDSGTVSIAGAPAAAVRAGVIGVVAQQTALYRNLSCRQNLEFFGALHGFWGRRLQHRITECLEQVGLVDRAHSIVRDLSGGMQRRLHVAVALVHEPQLVILDEPSTGLDVESRHEQWALIRRLQQRGAAVLLATHLLDEAEALCSRLGLLQAGALVAEGTPDELRSRVQAAEVALVQSPDVEAVLAVAARHQLETRRFEHDVALWLPRKMELRELAELLAEAPITSLARRPVTLADAYVELTRPPAPPAAEPRDELA